jgi:ATP synthase protein I
MNDLVKNGVSPVHSNGAPGTAAASWDDEVEPVSYKPLTREQALELRKKHPSISPWRVVATQALVGVLCCLVVWLASGKASLAWSALYGAGAVVLPGALLARGMTRGTESSVAAATRAAMGFLFWEMLKIAAAVSLLVMAAKVVPDLSWPALLITMVVCMKVNWFALLWRGR